MNEQELKELDQKLDNIVKKIDQVHQGLYGIPDTEDKGALGRLKEVCDDHSKLKRNFWILVSFLAGSGVLGTSIWALLTQ